MTPEQLRELPIGTLLYHVDCNEPDSPYCAIYVIGTVPVKQTILDKWDERRVLLDTAGQGIEKNPHQAAVHCIGANPEYLHLYKLTKREAAERWIQEDEDYGRTMKIGQEKARELWCHQ